MFLLFLRLMGLVACSPFFLADPAFLVNANDENFPAQPDRAVVETLLRVLDALS
jgi:hypothetical protein